ncbi:uncharacterized protein LOC26529367 isoform X2 [Drosophila willistoni]|uniref:uncharacterized protein LOC26529367 isoform X2 n=1 Tax=Drosophila willistoni TaxID=7260 RepID=UPI001F07D581|nr:uncharacterized protein LOC26529367 isoform X2 [Drosophila willistoni]
MSHCFKIGSMQACLRSYMKHCHVKQKVNTPRECPPGPLQRLLAKKKSSQSMMRTNRLNRDIHHRKLNHSTRTFSNLSSEGGVKDKDMANFDLVNFEPIERNGDYWQVLVTLKKRNADGRHLKHRTSSRQLGVTNAVSAIRLGSFYKDLSSPQKMKRLDMPKLVRYVKPSRKHLDSHKVIESISNLLTVATEKVLRRHDRVDRKRFIGKHIAVPRALKEIETEKLPTTEELLSKFRRKIVKVDSKNQKKSEPLMHSKDCDSRLKEMETEKLPTTEELLSKFRRKIVKVDSENQKKKEPLMHSKDSDSRLKEIETEKLPTTEELLSKFRRKIVKVNSKNQKNTEPLMHSKDCDSRLKTLRNQIQKSPLTKSIPLTASSECHAKESEIVPRQHKWLLGSIRKSSSNIKRFPRIHIKIRGSINIKRNSLGQFKGTSQTKVLTTTPKNGGSIF